VRGTGPLYGPGEKIPSEVIRTRNGGVERSPTPTAPGTTDDEPTNEDELMNPMRKTGRALLMGTAVAGALVMGLGAEAAGALPSGSPVTVKPLELAGWYRVSGDGCLSNPGPDQVQGSARVLVGVVGGRDTELAGTVDRAGRWSVEIDLARAAPGAYVVSSTCMPLDLPGWGGSTHGIAYDNATITIDGPAPAPTAAPEAAPTTKGPKAPAKPKAVKAQPRFTG
jgi:hypothetical protein